MKNFTINKDMEYVLSLIEKDSSLLSHLNIDELEEIADYLSQYKKHLIDTQGA